MAFQQYFGNLPIIRNVFNIAPNGDPLSNGWALYSAAFPNGIDIDTVKNECVNFGMITDAQAWADAHKRIFHVDIKSTSITQQNTSLTIECTGQHSAFGTPVADFSYLANPLFNLPQLSAGGIAVADENTLYGFAIAGYTDALGTELNSVGVYFVITNRYNTVTNFDASFICARAPSCPGCGL